MNRATKKVSRLIWVSRKAPVKAAPYASIEIEEDEDGDNSNNGDNSPRLGDLVAPDDQDDEPLSYPTLPVQPEAAATSIPGASTRSPVSLVTVAPDNPAKRKRVSAQRDVYEMPVTDDEAEGIVKGPTKKMAKRTHLRSKAKEPKVSLKKSNDQPPSSSSRQTRSGKVSGEIALARQPLAKATLNEDGIEVPSGGKPKRGRPRKPQPSQLPAKATPNEDRIEVPSGGKRKRGRPRKVQTSTQDDNEEEPVPLVAGISGPPMSAKVAAGGVEGISSILENPSPVKVSAPPATTSSHASDDEGLPELANIGRERHQVQEPSEAVEEEISTPIAPRVENSFLDFELLDRMLEMANRVGHTWKTDTNEWQLVTEGIKLYTNPGKKIYRALGNLKSLYEKLRGAIAMKNLDSIQGTSAEITNLALSIKEQKIQVLSERLGNPAGIAYVDDVKKTRSLLTDLYFNILPELLECIKLAAQVYDENGIINTPHLREVADLIEVHYDLATAAVKQPKNSQPRKIQIAPKKKNVTFQIQRPTQLNIPLLRDLLQKSKGEINSRAAAEKAAESLRLAQEHEIKRQRQERIDSQERRRRRKEVHKQQREDLARQLEDPIWGPILRDQMARDRDAEAAKQALEDLKKARVRRSRVTEPQLPDEESIQDDPFEDDQYEQRISVFPNNNRLQNESQPWSDERMNDFIEFMRTHDGMVLFIEIGRQGVLTFHRR